MARFPSAVFSLALLPLLALPFTACAANTSAAATSRVELPATAMVDGLRIEELSGLAWDADEQLLYAVSDQGAVFQFRIEHKGGSLTKVTPVAGKPLRKDANGTIGAFNAEGLTLRNAANGVRGDSELVVSLEGDPPQLMRFRPDGFALGALPVPAPANDPAHYRKRGRGLESVTLLADGSVLTAPESPLLGADQAVHTVYAEGHQWRIPRVTPDSRLKAMERLRSGGLLVLERSKMGSKSQLQASLREVDLSDCGEAVSCKASPIVSLPVGSDNFEGMALLEGERAVLLVSDNGGLTGQPTAFVRVVLP